MKAVPTVTLFGLPFSNISVREAVQTIIALVHQKSGPVYAVTPNVDHIVQITQNPALLPLYQDAYLILIDGQPLMWSARLLGQPLKEKVSGSDLFIQLMPALADQDIQAFFLGGDPGVAEKAADTLCEQYPNLRRPHTYCPPFGFEFDPGENHKIVDLIDQSKAQILFVGVGAPKQEKWLKAHIAELKHIQFGIGIGASFDFVAGTRKRAPLWMQKNSLEWLYRLLQEPKRLWRRYLVNDSYFVVILAKALFRKYILQSL